ncbi:hypothetical protein [Microbispora sp. NPDC049125]|uniref:hypothetical protein n=1 Tax=Microbispora sp. NPDC049125 TaxID=3154929 RepID=UPI0034652A5F
MREYDCAVVVERGKAVAFACFGVQQPPVLWFCLEGDNAFVRVVRDDQKDLARHLVDVQLLRDGRPWLTPGSASAVSRALS